MPATVPQTAVASPVHPVLIGGAWAVSTSTGTFTATDPRTGTRLTETYPVSGPADIEAALVAAAAAATELRALPDAGGKLAAFLEAYAAGIEKNADAIVAAANSETGLPVSPRLKDVELPRTTNQLRQAAATAASGDWQRPTIDTKAGLRSCLAPIGPVWVIGPNNFPFAYNGIAGGDFASAIAAGNPVIAKGHPLHPTTSRLLAEIAFEAVKAIGLPTGTVQMLYHLAPEDGLKLIADPRLKAIGFTGSRFGGLKLKAAADAAGKPFFGEMSSVNPVVVLPGALAENGDNIADQLVTSVTLGTGQFCTKPGIVVLPTGKSADAFVDRVKEKLSSATPGVLFSEAGRTSLTTALGTLTKSGATVITGGAKADGEGYRLQNTLLTVPAASFMKAPHALQTEAFGNAVLVVTADNDSQVKAIVESFEGNLTGTVYSATTGTDDAAYDAVAAALRPRVGRLLNDKMPTGVAVSPAQNHGGPFPSTSQPHFTAVGFPAAALRFTQLESFDNVRTHRLPVCLQDRNPTGKTWRLIDGTWTQASL